MTSNKEYNNKLFKRISFSSFIFVFLLFGFTMFFSTNNKVYAAPAITYTYEYKDISTCYIDGKEDPVDRVKTKGRNGDKYYCAVSASGEFPDNARLKEENACGTGYELYSLMHDIGSTTYVNAVGCRKETGSQRTTTKLHCIYHYNAGVVMFTKSDANPSGFSVKTQWRGLGDDIPSYDDKDWLNISESVEVIVKGKAFNEMVCPNYLFERFTTKPNSNQITGFLFCDDRDCEYAGYETYDYPLAKKEESKFTEKWDESGEPEQNEQPDEYYTNFYGDEVNLTIEHTEWLKECAYIDEEREAAGLYELYFNDSQFAMRAEKNTEKALIQANFTLAELLKKNSKECPTALYYARDGTYVRFWLDDAPKGALYYRDKMVLYEAKDPEPVPVPDPTPTDPCDIIPDEIREWIGDALNLVKYVALAIVIVLGVLDFLKAAGSGEAEAMKKAGTDFLKRIIAVIILFLIPLIVDLILNLIEIYGADSTCLPE